MHIDIIVTLAVAVFGSTGFWSWVQSRGKHKSAESRLLLGIAYGKIIQSAERYIQQGYIPTEEYNELYRYLYEPYKAMGGDGTAEKLMQEVKALPTAKEDLS